MKKIFIIFLLAFFSCSAFVFADELKNYNELYRTEKYEEAYTGYASMLVAEQNNPKLWYNAGNALFKMERMGDAVYAYAKAFMLAPRNPDIRFNLEFAMRQTGQAFVSEGTPKALYLLFFALSDTELKAAIIVLFWFTVLAVCASIKLRGKKRLLAWRVFIVSAFLLLSVGSWAWARHYSQFSSGVAVITNIGGLKLLSGPGENFTEYATAPEGRLVRVLNEANKKYYEIGLEAEGISGWAVKSGVKKL